MDRKKLERKLQNVEGFSKPDADLEQYQTPPSLASMLLWHAYISGDLEGKKVYDLGCGTGILSMGAKLLGAKKVTGVDVDEDVLERARENAKDMELEVDFKRSKVSELESTADLVIQNPPFGSQKKGSDRPFIRKSLEIAPIVYSFHKKETEDFVERFVEDLGGKVAEKISVDFPLKKTMPWHEKEIDTTKVNLYRFERKD